MFYTDQKISRSVIVYSIFSGMENILSMVLYNIVNLSVTVFEAGMK